MTKRVLIIVGIPEFDYSNEMSAVASFLRTIKTAFEAKGYLVEYGYTPESRNNSNTQKPQGKRKLGLLKSIMKKWKWLYQSLAYRSFFKKQDRLTDFNLKKDPFDLIIEFHTAGSTLGKQLAKIWNAELSVIFDSPVEEQFYEMHGTKTIHWSRILSSEKETLEAADSIMVYSPACEAHIRTKYSINGTVNILPCVVSKTSVSSHQLSDTFNIGFIGSFLKWHNVEMLVHVFSRFYKQHKNARLQLIGYGVEWQKIKNLVSQLNLTAVVEMPGFVNEDELLQFKSQFSVAIMPGSNWYGSPLKLFEYAESRIPFIAPWTKTVSSIFLADEHCLYIDPDAEEESTYNLLVKAKNETLEMYAMANRAAEFVAENFQEKVYGNKLVDVLM